MDQLEQFRGVLLLLLTVISIGTIIGSFLVYKYKIQTNCAKVSSIDGDLHDMKENKFPFLVTRAELLEHCINNKAGCQKMHDKRDAEVAEKIDKLETTILTRLDKMDTERNEAKEKESHQRVTRIEAFTKMAATVENLSIRFERVEDKIMNGD